MSLHRLFSAGDAPATPFNFHPVRTAAYRYIGRLQHGSGSGQTVGLLNPQLGNPLEACDAFGYCSGNGENGVLVNHRCGAVSRHGDPVQS